MPPCQNQFPILGRKSVAHRRVRLCEIDHSRGGDPRAWRGCGGLLTPAAGPGLPNKQAFQIQKLMGKDGSVSMELNDESEVYHLRDAVWKAAGMAPFDGCLCIGCLEKRLGRQLRGTDFDTSHPFNRVPGTPRLMERRAKPFKPTGRLPTLDD